jgi:hypothetical protein
MKSKQRSLLSTFRFVHLKTQDRLAIGTERAVWCTIWDGGGAADRLRRDGGTLRKCSRTLQTSVVPSIPVSGEECGS